ncbi:MAG: deoxynucleoside kinase [Marinilabiliales bacterium]|nr:deoxynucleoside kinase [Marinilabiliales bacterium]
MSKSIKTGAMHIAIAGNIGSGKTTLTGLLSKHYQWDAHYEDVDENPYLNDFYEDMQRWSFNLQIYFLNSRLGQILKYPQIRKNGNSGSNHLRRCFYFCAQHFMLWDLCRPAILTTISPCLTQ